MSMVIADDVMYFLGMRPQVNLIVEDNLLHALNSRVNELELENSDLRNNLAEASTREQERDKNIQQLIKDVVIVRSDWSKTTLTLQAVGNELVQRTDQLIARNSELHKSKVDLTRTAAQLTNYKSGLSLTYSELISMTTELAYIKQELSETRLKLRSTKDKLNKAESTISTQVNKIQTLIPHLEFRKSIRLRCLLTFRRDKLRHDLRAAEEEKVREANTLAHGADCLFDMRHVVNNPESPLCCHYETLYGLDPKWIARRPSSKLLIKVTNQIGDIHMTLGTGAADYKVRRYREPFERAQNALMGDEVVSDAKITDLETEHRSLLSTARRARRQARSD